MAVEPQKQNEEEGTRGQRVFDNWILLFILSILLNILLYNVWGLLEVAFLPPFQ